MSPPFVEEYISRDLSSSLLLESAVCSLKETGEKAPGVDFWVRVRRIPAQMCDNSANLTVRQERSSKSALPELDFSSVKFPNARKDSECFLAFKCEKSPSHADGQTAPNATTTC